MTRPTLTPARERGIPCPLCGDTASSTINTRGRYGYIIRRRQCSNSHRYTTHEAVFLSAVRRRLEYGYVDAAKARIDEVLR